MLLIRNHESQMQWNAIIKVLKEKDCQPRTPHTSKLSFRKIGQIEIFPD